MKRLPHFLLLTLLLQVIHLPGKNTLIEACPTCNKYLYWTGEVDHDFFNEQNWRLANQQFGATQHPETPQPHSGNSIVSVELCLPGAHKKDYQICLNDPDENDKVPAQGTIDPGQEIAYNLFISNGSVVANGDISFAGDMIGLTLDQVKLEVQGHIHRGVISITGRSTIKLLADQALGSEASINLLDAASWVYFMKDNPDELLENPEKFWVDDQPGTINQNLRINQYYQAGSLVRKKDVQYKPLTIRGSGGNSAALEEVVVYKGGGIPGGLNNGVSSFTLKRGYMATFAIQENGTGKSKVYIASEEDLNIEVLPAALQGNISFIRVLPWNWVTKKGTGGLIDGLNAGWFYNWGNGENSKPNFEYVPMAWGAGAASPTAVAGLINKDKVSHLLGFNESDNCNDQSGQFNNLCEPEIAVSYYENLMQTGLRLGTPAPRENGPTTWLKEFARIAKERDVRFDFVAVHWYDWASNPQNSPNADPVQVFNRFKAYLANVYQIYELPIWITEFNANPNRENTVNAAFLELALPYLESLDYVERYAYFQPDARNATNVVSPSNYFDPTGNITNIGIIYRDHKSTPSITDLTLEAPNNLEGMDQPYIETTPEIMTFEAECGLYKGGKWNTIEDSAASGLAYIQGNSAGPGTTVLSQQIHFEMELEEDELLRLWVKLSNNQGTNGALLIKMDDGAFANIGGMNSADFSWFRIPRYYQLSKGKHRLTIQYLNIGTKVDQIALVNGSNGIKLPADPNAATCGPSTGDWGIEDLPKYYWAEAEAADILGSDWQIGNDDDAIGGQYIEAGNGLSSIDVPPGTDGLASYVFTIENNDEFNIWGKVQALSGDGDAFWFSVDGEPFRKWDGLENPSFLWKWNKFYFTEGDNNRPFTYFLSQGQHTITIAYNESGAKIDRLAIASTALLPSSIDADVLMPDPILDFEAEHAILLGTAAVVSCGTSSNGQQVNVGLAGANGVRFDNVVVPTAGAYRLSISYMSAAATRNCRLWVNGVDFGIMTFTKSGEWCFNGGSPGIYMRSIPLNQGANIIEFRAVGTEAPFLDKISLLREVLSLEAELATLVGGAQVSACGKASNGASVNLAMAASNGVRFDEIDVPASGTYTLDVSYVSKVARDARIFVNGALFQTANFGLSGNWCFEGGATKIMSFQIPLNAGTNQIEIKPTGADAPFIDKIAIVNPSGSTSLVNTSERDGDNKKAVFGDHDKVSMVIYPNPVGAQESFYIKIDSPYLEKAEVIIYDLLGKPVWSNRIENQTFIEKTTGLPDGIYMVALKINSLIHVQKLVIR